MQKLDKDESLSSFYNTFCLFFIYMGETLSHLHIFQPTHTSKSVCNSEGNTESVVNNQRVF